MTPKFAAKFLAAAATLCCTLAYATGCTAGVPAERCNKCVPSDSDATDGSYAIGPCECYGVDSDPGHPRKPHRTMPGDRDRGDCPPYRYRVSDQHRAGSPHSVAPWATCARPNTCCGGYTAWFVGGGAAFADLPGLPINLLGRGRHRKANGCGQHGEGTWGLDYQGLAGHANVWLRYTRGRNQGGEGKYETDGEPAIVAKLKERIHDTLHHETH